MEPVEVKEPERKESNTEVPKYLRYLQKNAIYKPNEESISSTKNFRTSSQTDIVQDLQKKFQIEQRPVSSQISVIPAHAINQGRPEAILTNTLSPLVVIKKSTYDQNI